MTRRVTRRASHVALLSASVLLAGALSSLASGCSSDDGAQGTNPGDDMGDASSGGDAASGADGGDGSNPGAPPAVTIRRGGTDALTDAAQYLTVRKSQTELPDASQKARCEALLPELKGLPFLGNAHTCAIFNPYVLDQLKDAASRRTFFAAGFHEAQKMVGHDATGNRRLAVEVAIDLLNASEDTVSAYVDAILDGARTAKVPVLFNLDAVDWWDARPDLWNFFDPNKPGYDPKNVDNVEWVSGSGADAPRAYWRNWGAQIRVGTPIPNLGSPTYRAAVSHVLAKVLPKLVDFEESLAPDERYLYAGAIVGTELAIGVNHYYYPNGNAYLADDPKCDPGLPYAAGCPTPPAGPCAAYNHSVCPPDFSANTSGGMAQLGYAADRDLSLGNGVPGRAQLDAIVRSYLAYFEKQVVASGLPADKVFSHTGGTFGANGPQSYDAAFVAGIIPGWSMYYGDTQTPSASVGGYVEENGDTKSLPWSSPEWLPLDPGGADSQATWFTRIEDSLNYRNNRMVSVANWEGVSPNANAVGAIGQSLSAPRGDACSIPHRTVLGEAHFSDASVVRFSAPVPGTVTYLNASSSGATTAKGTLATIDLANEVLPDTTLTKTFAIGGATKVYIQLAVDGCVRGDAAQRMLSPVYALDVGGGSTPMAQSPVMLFADQGRRIATMSWTGATGKSLSIDFDRDPSFGTLESATFDGASSAFYADGFNASFPLYARLHDGAGVSNVVKLQ